MDSEEITVEIFLVLDSEQDEDTRCTVVRREIDVPNKAAVLSRVAEFWNSEDCAAIIYIDPCPVSISAFAIGDGQEFAVLARLITGDGIRLAVLPRGCTLACTRETYRELSVLCPTV